MKKSVREIIDEHFDEIAEGIVREYGEAVVRMTDGELFDILYKAYDAVISEVERTAVATARKHIKEFMITLYRLPSLKGSKCMPYVYAVGIYGWTKKDIDESKAKYLCEAECGGEIFNLMKAKKFV